jgi:hypothetical protein
MKINDNNLYKIPVSEDGEYIAINHLSMPSFAQFTFPFYSFTPNQAEDIGRFKI